MRNAATKRAWTAIGGSLNLAAEVQREAAASWPGTALLEALKSGPIGAGLLVCLGYYLGAKLGFALTLQPQPVSVLWPPNSILLAALLLTPPRAWPVVLLFAFPAHWAAQWQSEVPFRMMICWFISNSFEALLGAACVRKFAGNPLKFDNVRTVGIFIAFGVFLGPLVSSFLDAGFVRLNGWGESGYWEVWRTRCFSNALAALTLVTTIVSCSRIRIHSFRKAGHGAAASEALVLGSAVLLVGYFVFVRPEAGPGREPALVYVPLPCLLWAAVRFGFTGASMSILAHTFLAIWGTAHGRGPFASGSALENALSLQIFLIVVSIPLLCLAAVMDERRMAQAALRESEERYREVVEAQTELICRFSPNHDLTFVNEAFCQFFTQRREDLIGRNFAMLLPESIISNALNQRVEHELLRGDGTAIWQEWVSRAVHGPNGEVIEFQAIGRDITDRKRAEKANEQLAHASRLAMVGELTASIAHEINQPLGAILSNADAAGMLLDANPQNLPEIKQILADIRKDDVRASEVIVHIRALLRKRQLEMHSLDTNQVAETALRLVQAEARQRNVKIELIFTKQLPPIQGDRIYLQQLFLNLILNAMDAMADTPKEQRRLRICTSVHESGGVKVSVSDTGRGIPVDRFLRLFESFYTTKPEGMGLGLSISRAIIEAHRGRIWAENNEGGGATFHFVLPARIYTSSSS